MKNFYNIGVNVMNTVYVLEMIEDKIFCSCKDKRNNTVLGVYATKEDAEGYQDRMKETLGCYSDTSFKISEFRVVL